MIQNPPITTKAELKQAVAHAQVGILQYARTFDKPPAAVTAGLGALQKDRLETRQKITGRLQNSKNDTDLVSQAAMTKRHPWSWTLIKETKRRMRRNMTTTRV